MNPHSPQHDPSPSEMNTPLLTVIIPVYNTAPYLEKCLNSVTHQTYRNLEIICIDDASTDGSADILKSFASADSRIKLCQQCQNKGNGFARNVALDLASGEYITAVDSDDFLDPNTYAEVINLMSDDVDVVHYGIQVEAAPSKWADEMQQYYDFQEEGRYELTPSRIIGIQDSLCCKLMRRSIIEQYHIRFPEGIWYEDYCVKHMYLSVCRHVYMYPKRLYHRVLRHDSIMGQTKQGHPKTLDRFPAFDVIMGFWVKQHYSSNRRELIVLLTNLLLNRTRSFPRSLQHEAQALCRQCIDKWQLQTLLPYNEQIQVMMANSWKDRLKRLFYRRNERKKYFRFFGLTLAAAKMKHNIWYWYLLGIPIWKTAAKESPSQSQRTEPRT